MRSQIRSVTDQLEVILRPLEASVMRKTLGSRGARRRQRRSPSSAQTKRPATFDDVLNIKAVQGATISPDGRQVIYTVRQWVSEQDKMEARTHVWKVADRRQRAGAPDHVRREGRQPAAVVARRQVHQLRVGARQRGSRRRRST